MMKKRTALFAGTALLSLAAATALYAVGENCITREGVYNLGVATCNQKAAVYEGKDTFGISGVKLVDFNADPHTIQRATLNVAAVIDGTVPTAEENNDLDTKAKGVRGLIDRAVNQEEEVIEEPISVKLKNLAKEIDGSNNLDNRDGYRLFDKRKRLADLIGTEPLVDNRHLNAQVRVAIEQIDATPNLASLQVAIHNIQGDPNADPDTGGIIGTDITPIENATTVRAKLAAVRGLIDGTTGNNAPVTIANALTRVQGDDAQGGIIGSVIVAAEGVDTSILAQLTAARNLIDGTEGVEDIETAIENIQGEAGAWAGIIGSGEVGPAGNNVVSTVAGSTAIADATNVRQKLDVLLEQLNTEVKRVSLYNQEVDNFTALLSELVLLANA